MPNEQNQKPLRHVTVFWGKLTQVINDQTTWWYTIQEDNIIYVYVFIYKSLCTLNILTDRRIVHILRSPNFKHANIHTYKQTPNGNRKALYYIYFFIFTFLVLYAFSAVLLTSVSKQTCTNAGSLDIIISTSATEYSL